MPNNYFSFKQFTIKQERCAFKAGTDGVLLGACADVPGAGRILDIGTGTGLIAIMLAQRSEAEINAIEPDPASFEQACENVKDSPWERRIRVENVSLQNYNAGDLTFDLIVCNPPYFVDSLKNPDPFKAAARHNISLTIEALLEGVRNLLAVNGKFQVIMPYAEGNLMIATAAGFGLFCNKILKIKPLPTSEIRRLILTFSRNREKVSESFLTIEHGRRHEFTEEYRELTKDFYLGF